MNSIRHLWSKIRSLLPSLVKRIVNLWSSFTRSPLNFLVPMFSWLALIEIIVLLGWSLLQMDRAAEKIIVSESFENNLLRVHVRIPKYVGQGESDNLSVSVENIDERTVERICIYILDDKGEHIWFPNGNEIEFENLQQDERQFGEVLYVIDNSMPEDIKSFTLSIVATYRYSTEIENNKEELTSLPLTRVQFSDVPKLQIDEFKGGLISLDNIFEESSQSLSGMKDLIGFLVTIFAGIVSLRGNFFEIFGRKKP